MSTIDGSEPRLEPLVSPDDARTIAAFMRHRIVDDKILALNPQATRSQLIRERFDRLVDDFCSKQ
jgi:hypothetical protein